MARNKAKSLLSDEAVKRTVEDVILTEARSLAPNSRVASAIDAQLIQRDGGIRIQFGVDRDIAPEARAFEMGSGLRSKTNYQSKNQLGPKGEILIRPKPGKTFLAFKWEAADRDLLKWSRIARLKQMREENMLFSSTTRVQKTKRKSIDVPNMPSFAGTTGDSVEDKLLFNYVLHPGVRAANDGEGYLGFAVEKTLSRAESGLMSDAVSEVVKRINKVGKRFPKS